MMQDWSSCSNRMILRQGLLILRLLMSKAEAFSRRFQASGSSEHPGLQRFEVFDS